MAGAGYLLFTAGQVLTATQVNTYLMQQSNMVFATTAAHDSALSAIKSEGMVTYQLDNNDLDIYNGSSFSTLIAPSSGTLTAWTPSVTQSGAVTVTVSYAKTIRVGRWIQCSYLLLVTGSGTGANAVVIAGLPVTAASSGFIVGSGNLRSAWVPANYVHMINLVSTTTLDLRSTSTADDNRLGISSFSAGLASSDTIHGTFAYEAAADA